MANPSNEAIPAPKLGCTGPIVCHRLHHFLRFSRSKDCVCGAARRLILTDKNDKMSAAVPSGP
jgi:hypothetical protein